MNLWEQCSKNFNTEKGNIKMEVEGIRKNLLEMKTAITEM